MSSVSASSWLRLRRDSQAVGGLPLYPRVTLHHSADIQRQKSGRGQDLGPARLARCAGRKVAEAGSDQGPKHQRSNASYHVVHRPTYTVPQSPAETLSALVVVVVVLDHCGHSIGSNSRSSGSGNNPRTSNKKGGRGGGERAGAAGAEAGAGEEQGQGQGQGQEQGQEEREEQEDQE